MKVLHETDNFRVGHKVWLMEPSIKFSASSEVLAFNDLSDNYYGARMKRSIPNNKWNITAKSFRQI